LRVQAPGGAGALPHGGGPVRDDVGEHGQRERTAAQDGVVERPDVEPVAECAFGLPAQPFD
jgi:hypothetical protein